MEAGTIDAANEVAEEEAKAALEELEAARAAQAESGEFPDQAAADADADGFFDSEGSSGQFALIVGGEAVTSHTVTLQGGKIETDRELKKGERVRIVIEGRVGEVLFADKTDSKTGDVVGCRRNALVKRESTRVEQL
jgi:hypothetical protein